MEVIIITKKSFCYSPSVDAGYIDGLPRKVLLSEEEDCFLSFSLSLSLFFSDVSARQDRRKLKLAMRTFPRH